MSIYKKGRNNFLLGLFLLFAVAIVSCKKSTLDSVTFGTFGPAFPANEEEARAAVNYCYTGMLQETEWSLDWNFIRAQGLAATDELFVNWGWEGFRNFSYLTPDHSVAAKVNGNFAYFLRLTSQITVYIDKISNMASLDAATKSRNLGELKALRGYYNSLMFSFYGPVPVRMKASEVGNPDIPFIPRPSVDTMISYIVNDLTDAIAVLPDKATGNEYGKFSKAAALTCRMKLYMNLKRWSDAIKDGEAIKALGFSLMTNYNDNFGPQAKGGNAEIILPIVCSPAGGTSGQYHNMWFAYNLPGDYKDPQGAAIQGWNGWRMPWATYRQFDTINDQRTLRLLRYYPCNARSGATIWRDALTGDTAATISGGKVTPAGTLNGGGTMSGRGTYQNPSRPGGAIAMKFDLDRSGANSQNMDLDFVVYRYADVLLLLAEAYNNMDRTGDAIPLINQIRNRAGLQNTTATDKPSMQAALEKERLFELWFEFSRREDLLRWGKFIQRAIDDGTAAANPNFNAGSIGAQKYLLWPIPRSIVAESDGVVKQNPGY